MVQGYIGSDKEYSDYHFRVEYKWGENKVIFPDLKMMLDTLKEYKNDPLIHPQLGDWSDKLHELDPFCDEKGSQRIGTFIRWIQEGYNAGKDRDIIIESANKKYAESWGADKIYWTRDTELIE